MRHMHDRINALENRTAPPKEEDTSADASNQFLAPMLGMGNDMLMIGNGPGYGE